MEQAEGRYIMLECPNTIFHIYVQNEEEGSKVELFLRNMQNIEHLGLNDIYNWCNRQKIKYDTQFNYHKGLPFWVNIKSYVYYYRQKSKYQLRYQTV